MPKRKFVVLFDHNGSDEPFVLYGTPKSVQQSVRQSIAYAERFPWEETPPEVIGEVEVNPTAEVAEYLDKAWTARFNEGEDRLIDVLGKLACTVDALFPEIEERREAHRQFSKMLFERIQACNKRRASKEAKSLGGEGSSAGGNERKRDSGVGGFGNFSEVD